MDKGLLLVIGAVLLLTGCKTPAGPATAVGPSPTEAPAVASSGQPESQAQDTGFSLGSLFQLAGYQQPAAEGTGGQEPNQAAQGVTELGNMITSVAAKSTQLSMNDPAHVTRQKAASILEDLKGWDSSLAASTSSGLVSPEMAQNLNAWVTRLRTEVQKLVELAPQPQTIQAVKHLAGSLQATFGHFTSLLNRSNALLGAQAGGQQ